MSTQALDGKVEGRPRPAPVREARRVWSSNPAVVLWGTMVGKKVVMAVTGFVFVGFVIAHMVGGKGHAPECAPAGPARAR